MGIRSRVAGTILALTIGLVSASTAEASPVIGVAQKPTPCEATVGAAHWQTNSKSDITFNSNGPNLWCSLHQGPHSAGQFHGTQCVYGNVNLPKWILTTYADGSALLICGGNNLY